MKKDNRTYRLNRRTKLFTHFLLATIIHLFVFQPVLSNIIPCFDQGKELCELLEEEDSCKEQAENNDAKWNETDTFLKELASASYSLLANSNTEDQIRFYKEFQSEIPVPPPEVLIQQSVNCKTYLSL